MTKSPNILWLMTDEQRTDSLSYAGAPWARTPNLDRVALSGARFSNAYTPSPVCVPARACMLTGMAASSIGVLNNHHRFAADDPAFLTWRLAGAGYQVASFGKQHYASHRRAFDVEGGQVLGDRVAYQAYLVPVDPVEAGVVRYDGGRTQWLFAGRYPGDVDETPEMANVRAALEWMRARDPSRPYLLRISFNAPHTPVVTPAPFDTMINPEEIDLPLDGPELSEFASAAHRDYLCEYAGSHRLTAEQVRRARQCYYGHVAFVDHAFGALLDELREMGELENTIIAFTSDHGCHLGDHGFFQKQSFWDVSARVPLFFAGPGIEPQLVDTPVNAGSLMPTLLDLIAVEPVHEPEYPSVAGSLAGPRGIMSNPVFSEIDYGLWCYRPGERRMMVRDGCWKLVLFRDPESRDVAAGAADAELYDLVEDPGERRNLAGDPAHAATIARLTSEIDRWDASRKITASSPSANWQRRWDRFRSTGELG